MNNLPKDPMMLFSIINTKLRDRYGSLEELCDDLDVDKESLIRILREVGFEYSPDLNKFI